MSVNKRNAEEGIDHIRYKNMIAKTATAPNVLILFGDSKVSSYFIISKSNLAIVSWSTIGLEALMMGIPVVSIFPDTLMYPLAKFSCQPQNFDDLKRALFSPSEYGVADDMKLFNWVSMAHEGQFFPTLSPRGQGGQLGKVYRLVYRLIDKLGAYNLFAHLFDIIWSRNIIFSKDTLLKKRENNYSSKKVSCQHTIYSYRTKIRKKLKKYEETLFKLVRDLKHPIHHD
jgi:hypothetical protein